MVRLQKRFAYKYKDKEHYKYVVTIPSETVEELEWQPQTDLKLTVSNKSIILKPNTHEELTALKPVKEKRRTSK